MTRHRLTGLHACIALLLVLAFALSGWKILTRNPPTGYVVVPQTSPRPDSSVSRPAAALVMAGPALQTSPDGRFRFKAQFVSAAPGQAVHAASIVELQDGRLRAVWFSGSREGAADVALHTAVMDAATHQWGAEKPLFERDQIQRGLWRYVKKIGNPVIARAPDGALVLWMVNVSMGGWAGSSVSWSRSTDDGATWGAPRRLVTSPFLNISTLVKGAPVAMADGGISLPVYHEFFTKFGEVLRLDSKGEVVDKIRIAGSRTSLQPVLLVAGPAQAQVYMRSGTARALMVSETVDAGNSWSTTRATPWSNPDSAVAGLVSHTGAQWLALNPASRNRDVLALLQTSTGGVFDDVQPWIVESSVTPQKPIAEGEFDQLLSSELIARGASAGQAQAYVFSAKRQLCNSGYCAQEYSYPYLLQSRDGYIHLVYTWHRTRIKHVWFDPLQRGPSAGLR